MENTEIPSGAKLILFGVLAIIVIILLLVINPIVIIGAGQRGVVFNNTIGVENRVFGEGLHFRIPFIESVQKMNVRVQKTDFSEDTASKDLQRIKMDVAVNWQLVPSKVNKVYQQVGDNDTIVVTLLNNRVQQAVKAEVSQYNAEEVQTERDALATKIQTNLTKKLATYDLVITNVSITNLDYTAQFNQAVENKQLAQQDAEKAKYLKQKAENEAAAKVAQAQGNGQAVRINADAQAYANDKVQQSLTPELLQKMLIQQWDGHYPTYMLGDSMPLLQLPTK